MDTAICVSITIASDVVTHEQPLLFVAALLRMKPPPDCGLIAGTAEQPAE